MRVKGPRRVFSNLWLADARPALKMSAAMFAEAAVLVGAYWVGIIQNVPVGSTTTLWVWQHGLMMPVMLVPILLRARRVHGHAPPGTARLRQSTPEFNRE